MDGQKTAEQTTPIQAHNLSLILYWSPLGLCTVGEFQQWVTIHHSARNRRRPWPFRIRTEKFEGAGLAFPGPAQAHRDGDGGPEPKLGICLPA